MSDAPSGRSSPPTRPGRRRRAVDAVEADGELIVVDDGSTDDSLDPPAHQRPPHVRARPGPQPGQGCCPPARLRRVHGPVRGRPGRRPGVRPFGLRALLEPLLDGTADVVFGSRFHYARPHRVLYFWHTVGNRVLTTASNMLTIINLTDMETCYKVFRLGVLHGLAIEEHRLGSEPEVTAKVTRAGWRIFEVGNSYDTYLRRAEEGGMVRRRLGPRHHRPGHQHEPAAGDRARRQELPLLLPPGEHHSHGDGSGPRPRCRAGRGSPTPRQLQRRRVA